MVEKQRFAAVLSRRLNRREVVASGLTVPLVLQWGCARQGQASTPGFAAIEPSKADRVTVPVGYRADVVLRWGDALFPGTASLNAERIAAGALLEAGAAAAQTHQFGVNCDGIGVLALDAERLLICVNHEYPNPALMFPGWAEARRTRSRGDFARRNPEAVRSMQAAVGISVVELRRDRQWTPAKDSRLNRRVTGETPIELAGPARGHALLGMEPVAGTLGNCAAGMTPWGTYLTAEENTDDFFGNAGAADFDAELARAYARFPPRFRDSRFRWEYADERFDSAVRPNESLKFGWVVELDPLDASRPIKKRTALGRFKHEGATTVVADSGSAVVYMGDDEVFEYFYKFVTEERFDPAQPDRNRDLLDRGTLYVARLSDDGWGEWVPLVWRQTVGLGPAEGFESQADVVIRCREAADRVGATALDRPEDVAVHPQTGHVYLACTANPDRAADPDLRARADSGSLAANPRAPNPHGHILEIIEAGDDAAATEFRWEVFVLAGDPRAGSLRTAALTAETGLLDADTTYFAGRADRDALSAFANPDNMSFDRFGNLWIVTDGTQPRGFNNGCFVCATAGDDRGAVRQFMSGPTGAEICGCVIEGDSLFLTVQHPGEGGTATHPLSRWPDGDAPRSSLIAIEPMQPGRRLGT